jgi:light-regulated signal transduction histidine kinase (bacteriophytochrome)
LCDLLEELEKNGMEILIAEERALKLREKEVREMQRRAAELETVNKELDALAHSVSHDLRAPLRCVATCAGIVEEDFGGALSAEGRKLIGVIRAECHRMVQMIEDLLAFSRLAQQPLKTRSVSMNELVSEILLELHPTCEGRSVQFLVGELGTAEADTALVKQALLNLLSNAIKFTSKIERPSIEVGSRSDPTTENRIYFVRDNGAGFDMKHAQRLFGVFERLHRLEEYEGTGVGLSIVQRIVRRHGGQVWAEAKVGAGATFYFTLPRLHRGADLEAASAPGFLV